MQRGKSKQKLSGKEKRHYSPLDVPKNDLYYIASKENLLKKFTLSFYNMETRKSNKHIVMENVGNIDSKVKKEKQAYEEVQTRNKK